MRPYFEKMSPIGRALSEKERKEGEENAREIAQVDQGITDAGTDQSNNDYLDACSQNSSNDLPLGCSDESFYRNRKNCGDTDNNRCWVAACGSSSGASWDTTARLLGYNSCSVQQYYGTSVTYYNGSRFRVVVRP